MKRCNRRNRRNPRIVWRWHHWPIYRRSRADRGNRRYRTDGAMSLILLVIVLIVLFGGGGYYYSGPQLGGGLGLVLVIVLIYLLFR